MRPPNSIPLPPPNRLRGGTVIGLVLLLIASACAPTVSFRQLQPGFVPLDQDLVVALGTVNIDDRLGTTPDGLAGFLVDTLFETFVADTPADIEKQMETEISQSPFARYSREGAGYFVNISGTFSAQDSELPATMPAPAGSKDKQGTVPAVKVDRICRLELTYQVVAAQGSIAGEGRYDATDRSSRVGLTKKEAARLCKHWTTLKNGMMRKALAEIANNILPHYAKVKRRLKRGSRLVNEGVAHAIKGDLEQAGQVWTALLPRADSLSVKDRIALYCNLGVYYESREMLEESAKVFTSCIEAGGDELCTEGLNSVGTRYFQVDRLMKSGI